MKNVIFRIIIISIFASNLVLGQDDEKQRNMTLNGYVTNMQSAMYEDLNDLWLTENLLHNRLNFKWYLGDKLTFSVQFRNRFIYGDMIRLDQLLKELDSQTDSDFISGFPSIFGDNLSSGISGYGSYVDNINSDNGFVDLSLNIAEGKTYLINFFLDRVWMQYTTGNLEIKAGRQRINWGQTFAWNPNDIFNTYNFYDFDYPERPGSDALRIQYYPNSISTAEAAVKLDSADNITAAGLYRFNKWSYDIQFLGGILNSEDFVIGSGWSGDIKGVSFRGELSYFHPIKDFKDTTGLFFATVSSEYIFSNSFTIQFEALYRQLPKTSDISTFAEFYSGPLSVKKLSFTEYNIFAQATYPVTPLLNATFGSMIFMGEIDGYYIGPSLSYSLMDNLDFSIYMQIFNGKFPDNEGIKHRQSFNLGFLRFKLSF